MGGVEFSYRTAIFVTMCVMGIYFFRKDELPILNCLILICLYLVVTERGLSFTPILNKYRIGSFLKILTGI